MTAPKRSRIRSPSPSAGTTKGRRYQTARRADRGAARPPPPPPALTRDRPEAQQDPIASPFGGNDEGPSIPAGDDPVRPGDLGLPAAGHADRFTVREIGLPVELFRV